MTDNKEDKKMQKLPKIRLIRGYKKACRFDLSVDAIDRLNDLSKALSATKTETLERLIYSYWQQIFGIEEQNDER